MSDFDKQNPQSASDEAGVMPTDTVKTYSSIIYIGTWNRDTGKNLGTDKVRQVCQEYVDDVGLCVWVTEGDYIYTGGREPGCAVHLMNYPRFPSTPDEIHCHAITLGGLLIDALEQYRVSIKGPQKTVMLSNPSKQA
jgi:hypothetical protein